MTRNQHTLSYNIVFIAKVSNHDGNPSWEPTSSDGKFTREGNMVGGGWPLGVLRALGTAQGMQETLKEHLQNKQNPIRATVSVHIDFTRVC